MRRTADHPVSRCLLRLLRRKESARAAQLGMKLAKQHLQVLWDKARQAQERLRSAGLNPGIADGVPVTALLDEAARNALALLPEPANETIVCACHLCQAFPSTSRTPRPGRLALVPVHSVPSPVPVPRGRSAILPHLLYVSRTALARSGLCAVGQGTPAHSGTNAPAPAAPHRGRPAQTDSPSRSAQRSRSNSAARAKDCGRGATLPLILVTGARTSTVPKNSDPAREETSRQLLAGAGHVSMSVSTTPCGDPIVMVPPCPRDALACTWL